MNNLTAKSSNSVRCKHPPAYDYLQNINSPGGGSKDFQNTCGLCLQYSGHFQASITGKKNTIKYWPKHTAASQADRQIKQTFYKSNWTAEINSILLIHCLFFLPRSLPSASWLSWTCGSRVAVEASDAHSSDAASASLPCISVIHQRSGRGSGGRRWCYWWQVGETQIGFGSDSPCRGSHSSSGRDSLGPSYWNAASSAGTCVKGLSILIKCLR